MTPAVTALESAGVPYELLTYEPPNSPGETASGQRDIGILAAEALHLDPAEVFKTLVTELDDGTLAVAVIPVATTLDLKALARAAGTKSARMATPERAERTTGYVTGGISPLGQKRRLPTYVALEANGLERIYVSAGRRGLELGLSPRALVQITQGEVCDLTR
jgi:Cys-tRNA(Pro)/Cys-tRNA(Cys) deacylase